MSDIFKTETLDIIGHTVEIEYHFDSDNEPPWENDCGHGAVRKTTDRHAEGYSDKKPGERPLNQAGRNEYQFYYDWQGACKLAVKDRWNTKPYDAPNRVERAVQADFDFLRSYLNDDWHYVGIVVKLQDKNGDTIADDSCWGFDSLNDYHVEAAHGMAADMVDSHIKTQKTDFVKRMREAKERKYWASRDVVTE